MNTSVLVGHGNRSKAGKKTTTIKLQYLVITIFNVHLYHVYLTSIFNNNNFQCTFTSYVLQRKVFTIHWYAIYSFLEASK